MRAREKTRVQWTVTKSRLDEVKALADHIGLPKYLLSTMADMMLLGMAAQLRRFAKAHEEGRQLSLEDWLTGFMEANRVMAEDANVDRGEERKGRGKGKAGVVRQKRQGAGEA